MAEPGVWLAARAVGRRAACPIGGAARVSDGRSRAGQAAPTYDDAGHSTDLAHSQADSASQVVGRRVPGYLTLTELRQVDRSHARARCAGVHSPQRRIR
jgi:hypothetical protein